jgi:hypothetical protein
MRASVRQECEGFFLEVEAFELEGGAIDRKTWLLWVLIAFSEYT